jgi:hypothetical protein
MSKNSTTKPLGAKALEMVMRDVLGGLEDFAIMNSYESDDTLQVIPLDQSLDDNMPGATRAASQNQQHDNTDKPTLAEVIPFTKTRE